MLILCSCALVVFVKVGKARNTVKEHLLIVDHVPKARLPIRREHVPILHKAMEKDSLLIPSLPITSEFDGKFRVSPDRQGFKAASPEVSSPISDELYLFVYGKKVKNLKSDAFFSDPRWGSTVIPCKPT